MPKPNKFTILKKIKHLKTSPCFLDLNEWEKEFITTLHNGEDAQGGVGCLADDLSDFEITDYLSRRQIEKVEEIWNNLGL